MQGHHARFPKNAPSARLLLTVLVLLLSPGARAADVATVVAQVDAGRFTQAEKQIGQGLAEPGLGKATRAALLFERERMRRIRLDFPLGEAEAKSRLAKLIPDLEAEEFAEWKKTNQLEHVEIDGTPWYFQRSVSNLFLLDKHAAARRQPPANPTLGPLETPHPHHHQVVTEALATGKHSVTPNRVQVTYTLTVNANAVPAGETVRAWLPFPRELPGQQQDIKLIETVPAEHQVAPVTAMQRTVYLEKPAVAGRTTDFSITYELTVFAQRHAIDVKKVVVATRTPELASFLAQRPPHIVFTDDLRAFSRKVVGDEKNPYLIARKLYAAVDAIPWAGAREYSTLSNISDYALHAGHADCGQQTLLLMTLLRLNGIPTRWQSGWTFSDTGYDNMHDWAWLYLAPVGWVPMDVTYGRFATGDEAIDGFYLGGMDAYRIAFNDDFSRAFIPAKQHVRSETVDSQRGEAEWRGGNLYFDQWDYSFKFKLLQDSSETQ